MLRSSADATKTQFTSFTGTRVHILTQQELQIAEIKRRRHMRILEKEAQEAKAKAREQVSPSFFPFFFLFLFPLLSETKASASRLGPHALASGRIH